MKTLKIKRTLILPVLIFLFCAIFAAFCLVLCTDRFSRPVIVHFTSGEYSRADGLLVIADRALLRMDSERFKTRDDAFKSDPLSPGWGLWSLSAIMTLEFLEKEQQKKISDQDIPYTGTWRIDAEGNPGYIFLTFQNDRYEGTIRFPQYAHGVTEPMRNIAVTGRKITFTRSASTSNELKRMGISTPFKQEYTGWFNTAGNYVKGQYVIPGSIRNWSGYRVETGK